MTRPICLLSDFGLDDEFVGVVHGVILRIAPGATVIDVTHGIPRGDVRAGALALLRAVQYLPEGVAMAVVDPGVGSARRAIAAATPWGHFVGPDNGLLAPAAAMVGGASRVVSLEDARFRLPRQGVTFDGRDVFAPAAASLAAGEADLSDLGPDVDPASLMPLLLPLVEAGDRAAQGEVWWVDRFGNAQTNVSPADLEGIGLGPGDTVVLTVGATRHELPWTRSYEEGEGSGVVHVDSYGMMTVAVPGGRADEVFNLRVGVSVGFRAPPDAAGSS
jgi:S-adenosylmethionine hydrolase